MIVALYSMSTCQIEQFCIQYNGWRERRWNEPFLEQNIEAQLDKNRNKTKHAYL